MNPRILFSLLILTSTLPVWGQDVFTKTEVKLKTRKGKSIVRMVKIHTEGEDSPIVLVNKGKIPGKGKDWVIFHESGGLVSFFRDSISQNWRAQAYLEQQTAEISQILHANVKSYSWQLSTRSDTFFLGPFRSSVDSSFAPQLYKFYTQELLPENQTPLSQDRILRLLLLEFAHSETPKAALSINETGQISDYSYLCKILAAFLATLETIPPDTKTD